MHVEHHHLHNEFPELSEEIHTLKVGNNHFVKLFDEYHRVTSKIEQFEAQDVPVDDFTIEEMKKQRIKLKDELYSMLVAQNV